MIHEQRAIRDALVRYWKTGKLLWHRTKDGVLLSPDDQTLFLVREKLWVFDEAKLPPNAKALGTTWYHTIGVLADALATDREEWLRTMSDGKRHVLIKLVTEKGAYAYIDEKHEKQFPPESLFYVAGKKLPVLVALADRAKYCGYTPIGLILPVNMEKEETENDKD